MINDDKKLKTKDSYAAIAKLYTQDFERDWEHFEIIKEAIDTCLTHRNPQHKVIDLGTGPGNVVDYLLAEGVTDIEAIDFSEEFVHFLSEKYRNSVEVNIIHSDMTSYVAGLPAESVAFYTAAYSIIHIPDEELDQLFANIYKTLIHNGMIVMSMYKGTDKKMEPDPYLVHGDKRLNVSHLIETYINYMTEAELKNRLVRAGFVIQKFTVYKNSQSSGDFQADIMWVLASKP